MQLHAAENFFLLRPQRPEKRPALPAVRAAVSAGAVKQLSDVVQQTPIGDLPGLFLQILSHSFALVCPLAGCELFR